jgi:hypothetical protein
MKDKGRRWTRADGRVGAGSPGGKRSRGAVCPGHRGTSGAGHLTRSAGPAGPAGGTRRHPVQFLRHSPGAACTRPVPHGRPDRAPFNRGYGRIRKDRQADQHRPSFMDRQTCKVVGRRLGRIPGHGLRAGAGQRIRPPVPGQIQQFRRWRCRQRHDDNLQVTDATVLAFVTLQARTGPGQACRSRCTSSERLIVALAASR